MCIAIDDEQDALKIISDFIGHLPNLNLLKVFMNPLEALDFLRENERVELVFMDVDMPLLSGVELSRLVRKKINKLVFTTSHSHFALDAFKVHADDFLLKPFGFGDFLSTVEKLFPENEKRMPVVQNKLKPYFYVKSKEDSLKLIKVYFDEVLAIESLLNYIRIHTANASIVTHLSLKEIKAILSDREEFVQFHRSFIISTKHIYSVEGNIVTVTNGAKFTVGDNYKDLLTQHVSRWLLKPATKNSSAG